MSASINVTERQIKIKQIEVLSIAEGFIQSSVLFALLKLNIFGHIENGLTNLDELAENLKVNSESLSRLLNAGVVLNLLSSKDGQKFQISSKYHDILSPGSGETYLGDWIASLYFFFDPISKLDHAVRSSGPSTLPDVRLGGDKVNTRSFALSMHNYATLRGKELADFLDTDGCKSLLDLGCGPGTYAYHLATRNPELEIYLADNPFVLETAKEVRTRYNLGNRVKYLPIDAMKEKIPGRYDIVLVSNMLHGLGEMKSRQLINCLYSVVNPGGSLVIQAQYLRDDRLGGRWPIFLDLIQLCVTNNGRNHSVAETKKWMEDAGFVEIEYCSMTLLNTNSYLRGFKKGKTEKYFFQR